MDALLVVILPPGRGCCNGFATLTIRNNHIILNYNNRRTINKPIHSNPIHLMRINDSGLKETMIAA